MSKKKKTDLPYYYSFDKWWANTRPVITRTMSGDRWKTTCLPEKSVTDATPMDRAVARTVSAQTNRQPNEGFQADLIGDLMMTMYNSNVGPKPPEGIPVTHRLNHMLIEWANSIPGFMDGRRTASGNVIAATISAGLLWETLLTEEVLNDLFEKQAEIEKMIQMAERLEAMADNLDKQGSHEYAAQKRNEAKDLRDKADEIAAQMQKKVEEMRGSPFANGMMSSAAKAAGEKAREVSEAMKSWGIEPGQGVNDDIDSIMKLLSSNTDSLGKISDLVGRFKNVALNTVEQIKNTRFGPVNEVTTTRDLFKTFPLARAYMSQYAPPYLRTKTVLEWVSRGLIGWRNKMDAVNEGIFAAAVDGSGSMTDAAGGGYSKEELAKTIALGIARAMHEDKFASRNYILGTFGAQADPIHSVTHEDPVARHIDWAVRSPGGGTDFDTAFRWAINNMNSMAKSGNLGADLLFITDGHGSLNSHWVKEWKKMKAERGSRLIYILVGDAENKVVENIADVFIKVSPNDLESRSDELVINIVRTVLEKNGKKVNGGG